LPRLPRLRGLVGKRQGNYTDEWLSMLQREAKQHDYYKTSISTAPESRHMQPTSHHGTGRNNATGVKSLATRLLLYETTNLCEMCPVWTPLDTITLSATRRCPSTLRRAA
jgi:hypothetical protein